MRLRVHFDGHWIGIDEEVHIANLGDRPTAGAEAWKTQHQSDMNISPLLLDCSVAYVSSVAFFREVGTYP